MLYQIKIRGMLDQTWSDWLGGVDVRTEHTPSGEAITLLAVDLIDQAALYGILDHLRDLNLTLVSVQQQEDPTDPICANSLPIAPTN